MDDLKYYKLCQYMYGKGQQLVADMDFTILEESLKAKGIEFNPRWESVTESEGIALMYEYSVEHNLVEAPASKEIQFSYEKYLKIVPVGADVREELEKFKLDRNKSIPIVTDNVLFTQFSELFRDAECEYALASLKLDGWNITIYVVNGYIVYAHTRGKIGEATEITSIMKCILRDIDGKLNISRGYIVGELILENESLEYLREKYGKDFKTTRNSVSSFINNKVVEEDLPLAKYYAFKLEVENEAFATPVEMYQELERNGFKIPKYELVKCNISEMANLVINWGHQINHLPPCDGIVFQPNSYLIKNTLLQLPSIASDSYENGIYAVKMGAWGKQVYKTIIKDITVTANTKGKRPSLIVEPVTSRDGRTITIIPIDHIGRLVDEDLYIGKEISISIVSEKDIRLVYDEVKAKMRTVV